MNCVLAPRVKSRQKKLSFIPKDFVLHKKSESITKSDGKSKKIQERTIHKASLTKPELVNLIEKYKAETVKNYFSSCKRETLS